MLVIANRGEGLGNFWGDLTRTSLYVLLPIAFVVAVVLAWLGVVQSLAASTQATTLEGGQQTISLFPTASQLAIKQLGINGGGVFNVNSAHPLENPSPLTNLITAISINVMGWAAFFAFGRSVLAKKDVRALAVAAVILLGAVASPSMSSKASRRPPWSPPVSIRRSAIWRARRSASACRLPWPGRPRRPAPPTARSTPCTPATCRWAGP